LQRPRMPARRRCRMATEAFGTRYKVTISAFRELLPYKSL